VAEAGNSGEKVSYPSLPKPPPEQFEGEEKD